MTLLQPQTYLEGHLFSQRITCHESPFKRSQKCRVFPRYSVADGQRILDPSVLTHTIPLGRGSIYYQHIHPTKINHLCIGKYTIVPWMVWVMSLGFKWSCWIIDVGLSLSDQEKPWVFKGTFYTVLMLPPDIYSGVKKVLGYQSAFLPLPWRVLLLGYLKKFENSLPLSCFNHL